MPDQPFSSLPLMPQESQALQVQQRQLRADLAAAENAARALAGQQERIYSLTAELTEARRAVDFAQQQQALAASRAGVLEKAHAAAVEVRSAVLCLLCVVCVRWCGVSHLPWLCAPEGDAQPLCTPVGTACMHAKVPAASRPTARP